MNIYSYNQKGRGLGNMDQLMKEILQELQVNIHDLKQDVENLKESQKWLRIGIEGMNQRLDQLVEKVDSNQSFKLKEDITSYIDDKWDAIESSHRLQAMRMHTLEVAVDRLSKKIEKQTNHNV